MKAKPNFFVVYPRKSYTEAKDAMQLIGYSIGMDCPLFSYSDVHDEAEYYQNIVVPAIEKADFVLAFICNGAENEYLLQESVRLCNNLNKSTIPVKLGSSDINGQVWNFRSSIIDFSNKSQRAILLDQIHAWMGSVVINGHVCIDLGLPSGTQWATCNIGAFEPEDSGIHYIWGETTPYKHEYTYKDNPVVLPPRVDAATVNWGKGWRMPTKCEMDELLQNCTWEWTGNGYRLTGPNGCYIFLPTTGCLDGKGLHEADTEGHYWSSTLRLSILSNTQNINEGQNKTTQKKENPLSSNEVDDKNDLVNLGLRYYNGDGVWQNYEEAFLCFKKAANQGNAEAQYFLGLFYEKGIGVAKNEAKAVEWYVKASKNGHLNVWYLSFKDVERCGMHYKHRFVARAIRAVHSNKSPMPNIESVGLVSSYAGGKKRVRKIIIIVCVIFAVLLFFLCL